MSDSIHQIILNLLDRMLDESIKNTEAISVLKSSVAEQRTDIMEIKKELQSQFQRERDMLRELKERLETIEEKKDRKDHYRNVDKFIETVRSPKTWLALIVSLIVAFSTIIGGAVTVFYRLSAISDKDSQPAIQPQIPSTNSSGP